MQGARGRRSFLAAMTTVSTTIASIGQASAAENSADGAENACSRRDTGDQGPPASIEPPNQQDALDMASADSGTDGRTAFIVGGIHGDERAGIIAAHDIADWSPDHGRLVVLPEANPAAVKQHRRNNAFGNLNRKFTVGSEPTSALAQSIWGAVTTTEPDVLISLHESKGILNGEPSGVGQTVFHRGRSATYDAARMGIRRANSTIGSKRFRFGHGRISGPNKAPTGLLSEKADYDGGIHSFIVETYNGPNEDARVRWQKTITRGILDYYDIYE